MQKQSWSEKQVFAPPGFHNAVNVSVVAGVVRWPEKHCSCSQERSFTKWGWLMIKGTKNESTITIVGSNIFQVSKRLTIVTNRRNITQTLESDYNYTGNHQRLSLTFYWIYYKRINNKKHQNSAMQMPPGPIFHSSPNNTEVCNCSDEQTM